MFSEHLGTVFRVSELPTDRMLRRKPLTGMRYDTVMMTFLLLADVLSFAGVSAILFSMTVVQKGGGPLPR